MIFKQQRPPPDNRLLEHRVSALEKGAEEIEKKYARKLVETIVFGAVGAILFGFLTSLIGGGFLAIIGGE